MGSTTPPTLSRVARLATLALALAVVVLAVAGTLGSGTPSRPYAPFTLIAGAVLVLALLPTRPAAAIALRLVAASMLLVSAILWLTA